MTARQEFIEDAIEEFYFRRAAGYIGLHAPTVQTLEEYATEIKSEWANKCTDEQFTRALVEVQRGVEKKLAAKADRWAWKNGNS